MANNNKHTGPNVPALRFPEFSGEWTKIKLGDLGSFFSGGTPSSSRKDFYGGEIPFIRSGELHSDSTALSITKEAYDSCSAKMVNKGDLLLALYGATSGDISISRISGAINQAILCIRPQYMDAYFIKSLWEKHKKHILETYLQGGQGNLSSEIIKNISFFFPNSDEQVKISRLIHIIDDRIETQSKIIEELKTLRGALVDAYINDGNNINENQTIMSLGAYGCFVRGLTYSSVDVTDNTATTGVVRSNNLEYGSPVDIKADLVYVTKKPSPEQMLVNGDIVICMANGSSSLVGKASNYQELCRNMTVGAFCGIYRGTHPLTKWIFMSSAYCKAVANAIQGGNGAIANLHAEDILSMCFAVPSDYKTITELGKLMSLFDEKLHAAEEQLARFIEQKKYFLFKMFI